MDAREALVALNLVEHVGPVRVRQLLEHFGEAPAILSGKWQQSGQTMPLEFRKSATGR